MTRHQDRAVFTICSWNYMAYALTLRNSFESANPGTPFYIFIADAPFSFNSPLESNENVIVIDEIIVPKYRSMVCAYGVMEYNTSVKPHCISYLMDVLKLNRVVYLDPDILVVSSLDCLFEALTSDYDCLLTPHITAPLTDGLKPDDLAISQSGIYNLGFIALRNTPATQRFLAWWRGWLETDCVVDLERGIFVDQRFCDFVPAFVERTLILRDPGYNLAYWNLVQRPLEHRSGKLYAGGSEVKFVHFSGVDKDKPEQFSKHQNRFTRENIGLLQPTFDFYVDSLRRRDAYDGGSFSQVRYGFGALRDGVPIIDAMRRCIRRYRTEIPEDTLPSELDSSIFLKITDRLPADSANPITRLLAEIYFSREDLRRAFDAFAPTGRAALRDWAVSALPREYGLPANWVISPGEQAPDPTPNPKHSGFLTVGFPFARKLRRFGLKSRIHASGEPGSPVQPTESATESGSQYKHGLAIYGFLNAETGVGQSARSLAQSFETTKVPMSCHSIAIQGCENNVEYPVSESLDNALDTALLVLNADNIQNIKGLMDPESVAHNRRIGLFAWELPVFPGLWASACDFLDEIWVPSTFVAESMKTTTEKAIQIMNYPIQLNVLDPLSCRRELNLPQGKLIYLVTFDFNSYPERKNPLGAIRAFIDAFPDNTNTSPLLIVKCHGIYNRGDYVTSILSAIEGRPNILLIDRVMSQNDILKLQAACDVYVSLHRSEGFGLNLAECMAAGKLVIATNFSGNLDFMNETNSILINYDMRRVREGEYVAWQGQWWAEARHDHAVEALRLAASSNELRRSYGETARRFIEDELSFEKVGARMVQYLG